MAEKTDLKSLSKEGMHLYVQDLGLPSYRSGQILHWIYGKYARNISDITELSLTLRDRISQTAYIGNLEIVRRLMSSDGTDKFLFRLQDGRMIESVLIPDDDRLTLCVSSQVGCAMGCRFCRTGRLGLIRNLRAHEIVDQIISSNRIISPRKITNIVFMGMGEPLANIDEVSEALSRIISLVGISKRRITVSTAGLVPNIGRLATMAPEVNLAISLNATTDAVRGNLMPINRKYPIAALLDACRRYPLSVRRRITFEYVMIHGINDSDQDALRLVKLLRGVRSKVNLIPFNPSADDKFQRPSDDRVLAFQQILIKNNMTALIRESRGKDIMAACGQLVADAKGV